ncbi:MAG: OmpA family protein [Endozoicomonas sp. (ex Botrylloides leachii)]|nr:OmpA family protein [Endozoicomonas sp. (ex Botrylloides leachii)]
MFKKRRHGAGHHGGGSWKIALADFAFAMMALFLLLWILKTTNLEARKAIASYFEDPGAFQHRASPQPIDFGSNKSIAESPLIPKGGDSSVVDKHPEFKELMKELEKLINNNDISKKYKDIIFLEPLKDGVRIVILDNSKDDMFELGSANINPFFQDLLLGMAPIIKQIDRRLIISGHTDSVSFQGKEYTNWELSSARAQAARKTLLFGGIEEEQIFMVLGMADRSPRDAQNPESSVNRRIEIMVANESMEARVQRMFTPVQKQETDKTSSNSTENNNIVEQARQNQP